MRERHILTEASVPELPRHVRLQFDALRDKWVVLAPEKVLWPDEISVEILKRCDGRSPVGGIVDSLAAAYDAGRGEVAADVIEFLQGWSDQRLLQLKA